MSTTSRLIRLKDNTLIEVEAAEDEAQYVSSKTAVKVQESLDTVKPLLTKVCKPVVDAWSELSDEIQLEGAEIEIGLSFEAEGNLYVTKAKAGANLKVKLVMKPKK